MEKPNIPNYRFARARQLLKRYFLVAVPLVLMVFLVKFLMTESKRPHRGRVDRDMSRIESTVFAEACVADLRKDHKRILIQLLSLEPEKTRHGVIAALTLRVCNPTNTVYTLRSLTVRYQPTDYELPGILWNVQEDRELGVGFCDNVTLESDALGELVRFRADDGRIEVHEPTFEKWSFLLPGCQNFGSSQ